MTAPRTYLDWNATAPLRPEAREAMLGALDAGKLGGDLARQDRGMAARVFVIAAVHALQKRLPQRWRVQPEARRDLAQHARRYADVDDFKRAAAPQSFE